MNHLSRLLACAVALISGTASVLADSENPNAILSTLSAQTEKEVRGDILQFWMEHTRNPENGGYVGMITADMRVKNDVPRGALLTSRILWTYSTAYRLYKDPAYLEMARYAYRDLVEHFWDKEDGGLFWTITPAGAPDETFKLIYGQVFGIYALSEYYRATGDAAALNRALEIYRLVEANARDRVNGGYFDALGRDWKRLGSSKATLLGPSPKSQNSHIHILEAYTNLLRVWPDPGLKANQRALFDVTVDHIIDPRTHHLVLFMKEDWTPTSDEISYGHDIELSWLIVEAANVLGDADRIRAARTIAVEMANATFAEGVDPDGGVLSEGSPKGLTNTRKEWWPQAEAVVGFLNAYQISGDIRFLVASRHTWDFIRSKFVDSKQGDWFNLLERDGTPLPLPKVSLWKCPYHSSRSCFEVISRVSEMAGREHTP